MVPEKGQTYLIQALSRLKEKGVKIRCIFVGEGPLQNQLEIRATELGVVDFCDFIGRRLDIELIYPALDIFVLPSLREPFGLALLEAMASGVPVVATDSGGPPAIINNNENGMLVPAKDEKALADRILDLIANKDRRERIGASGRRTVKAKFDIRSTVSQIQKVYYSVADGAIT
jgi:glycosyltransferase involved in cell wall biosynthesis